jgi:hypothetical protein
MKNYRELGMALLLSMSLSFTLSYSQEIVTITPKLAQQIEKNYLRIYSLKQQELESPQRTAYLVVDVVPAEIFIGTYTKMPIEYQFARSASNGKFVQNELVDKAKQYYDYSLSETIYTVIKADSSDALYAIPDQVVKQIDKFHQTRKMLEVVHKLGYKEYVDGEDLYVKSKTADIRLDVHTYNELLKNPNYITQLDNDQIKIAGLVKQTIPHSKTLDGYLSIYNVKRSKTPVATLNAWKAATAQAIKLNNQIYSLNEKYEGNYSFTLLDKSNTLDVFLDNLNASKGVLGM